MKDSKPTKRGEKKYIYTHTHTHTHITFKRDWATRSKVAPPPLILHTFLKNSRNTQESPKCPAPGSNLPPTPSTPWSGPQEAVAGARCFCHLHFTAGETEAQGRGRVGSGELGFIET